MLLQMLPGPGAVLLSVKAVGINFRDVLNVLGMYPGDPGALGSDCAGVIMAAGEPGSTAALWMCPGALLHGVLSPRCSAALIHRPWLRPDSWPRCVWPGSWLLGHRCVRP
jgi:hypothetical protein